jgi:asparagine synthase (glutamine-hydrolysing)
LSAICGVVGRANAGADASVLAAMLDAVDYRGDRSEVAIDGAVGLGYRWWTGRPGKSEGVHRDAHGLAVVAGALAPSVAAGSSPAAELADVLASPARLAALDGSFAGARWDRDVRRLALVRDPFGMRSLYYVEHAGAFYFASELKQLLAIPGLAIEADPIALHKYLTFSFVPGEDVPVRGIKRLLPGRIGTYAAGTLSTEPYFALREALDPALADQAEAVRLVRRLAREAIAKRVRGEREVGLYLSGGIDSSGVAVWLKEAGVDVRALSLDFGNVSVEREQARAVAAALGIRLEYVPITGDDLLPHLDDLVWKLDLPFGDPVTGPQYLLGRAARAAGLTAVFNGEGGDQLFGGWTSKPMVAAELYAGLYGEDTRAARYLESYHRFYGLEDELYTPAFRDAVGAPGQRRAVLEPYLTSQHASTFLNRVRLADISLKGSQNILPRMDRTAQCWGLDVRAPLFDRALAEASFRIPPQLKLRGATEKFVLKLALQPDLPKEIVWRRKFGMSVPITEWALGPLASWLEELLGPRSLAARGLFRDEYVTQLRAGRDTPDEIRRRRIGERLWTLAMLEAWLRIFIDGRGKRPRAAR